MLAALKKVLIDYFKTMMAPGEALSGIMDIRSGRIVSLSVPGIKFPFISISVEKINVKLASGKTPYYMESLFMLELYTVSNKALGVAEDECLKLFLSDDLATGIMKLFHDKQSFYVGTQPFLVTPNDEDAIVIAGGSPDDAFTYAIRLPLKVITWKD